MPESAPEFPMSLILNTIPKDAAFTQKPEKGITADYGAYIVNAAACAECHTNAIKGKTKLILHLTVYLLVTYMPTFTFAQYLDNTFGTAGLVNTSLGSFGNMCNSVVIQGDQKIVFAGSTQSSGFSDFAFAIARCNSDGTLDNTFGTGGKVVTPIEPGSEGNSVAIQSDGKILLGGSSGWFINLVRYNGDGSLDTTFGTGGKVITDIDGYYNEKCKSVAIQS